jgi:hypothetical protein
MQPSRPGRQDKALSQSVPVARAEVTLPLATYCAAKKKERSRGERKSSSESGKTTT